MANSDHLKVTKQVCSNRTLHNGVHQVSKRVDEKKRDWLHLKNAYISEENVNNMNCLELKAAVLALQLPVM